VGSPILKYLA